MNKNFKFFALYKALEDYLKGKEIVVRLYSNNNDEYEEFCDIFDYSDQIKNGFEVPLDWVDSNNFIEWRGTVESIGICDSSRIDIYFDKNKPHAFPEGYYEDCFSCHMLSHIKIMETNINL